MCLKIGNKNVFGNLDSQIDSLREDVSSLDSRVDLGVLFVDEVVARSRALEDL